MNNDLQKVKDCLYDIMTSEPADEDKLKMTQMMPLNVESIVRDKAVFIYQNHQVLPKVVIHRAVEGMRILDSYMEEKPPTMIHLQPQETVIPEQEIPKTSIYVDIRGMAQYFMDNGYTVKQAQKAIRDAMWELAFEKHKKNNQAIAKCMKVSKSYVSSYKCNSQRKKRAK